MAIERTLVIIPDGIEDGFETGIIKDYKDNGLVIVMDARYKMTVTQVDRFYAEHIKKPFFKDLKAAMTSVTSLYLVLEKEDARDLVRKVNRAANADEAEIGTIRNLFKSKKFGGPFHVVYGSNSERSYERDRGIIFG